MADEPENLTLALLREIRTGQVAMQADIDHLRAEMRKNVSELSIGIAALSTDLKATKAVVDKIHETQKNHGARLNAIDGRLAIIEGHAGLVKA
jgi:hypothetical protein